MPLIDLSVPNLQGPVEVVPASRYDALRGVVATAIEELDGWRDKGSDVMRDELVDDFLAAAKHELGLVAPREEQAR